MGANGGSFEARPANSSRAGDALGHCSALPGMRTSPKPLWPVTARALARLTRAYSSHRWQPAPLTPLIRHSRSRGCRAGRLRLGCLGRRR